MSPTSANRGDCRRDCHEPRFHLKDSRSNKQLGNDLKDLSAGMQTCRLPYALLVLNPFHQSLVAVQTLLWTIFGLQD